MRKKGILDYMQLLLVNIKKVTGNYFYNSVKIQTIITDQQHSIISDLQSQVPSEPLSEDVVPTFPFEERNFYGMQGLQMFMRKKGGIGIPKIAPLYKSKDGTILKGTGAFSNSNISFIIKKSQRVDELVNEVFVGLTSINQLIREIPNFRYTYCISRSGPEGIRDTSILENIDGDTFKKYINDGCSLKDFVKIIMIILLALSVAQERTGFVHNDLYPWNIIMLKVKRQKIAYQFRDTIIVVETDIIPVIIDYGRAHVIYEENHYGTMKPFKTNLFQDCFCLLISSIYEMTLRNLSPEDIKALIAMTNFFTNTDLQKEKITDHNQLVQFLGVHKKYNEMVFGDKCALEIHNPVNLFFYLLSSFNSSDFTRVIFPTKVECKIPFGNPLFYYDIIVGKSPRQDIIKYLDDLEFCGDTLYGDDSIVDVLTYTNNCNYFYLAVKGVLENFGGDDKVTRTCNRILDRIAMKSFSHLDQMTREIKPGYINTNANLNVSSYSPETFSIPGRILTKVQGDTKLKKTFILSLRHNFIFNMMYDLPYKVPDEDKFFIQKKFFPLIKMNPLVLLNHNANVNTLKNISRIIYTKDTEALSKIPGEEKPVKTLAIFKEILSVVKEM